MMPELPTGTVTFLFTDIEGSTRLAQELGQHYAEVLAEQQGVIRGAIREAGGHEVGTQGDGFFVVFPSAKGAVAAAIAAQKAIAAHRWPLGATVRVRMGLHTGEGRLAGDDYAGLDVHRAARISAAGHGGQILLSEATRALVDHDLPGGAELVDLGPHRLKDLLRPEHIFQVAHPDLPSRFPRLKSVDALPNNLPVQLTSFIGREQDMAEVKRLLAQSRLVTLLGAGGAGKTRLAIQVAADLLEVYPDGVWLVELAPIVEPALVPQTVASALDLREPAREATDALVDFLRPKSLLLVIDNCEQVLSASADLCAHLLRQCPHVRILTTTRETLAIAGEATYRVPPLPLPDPQHPLSPDTINQYAAMRLFMERAVLVHPGFQVTTGNVKTIADICRRLDGIPLAIELAAARVKVLSVEQIAARLEDRFRLLTGGTRTGLPHHQTLRAAMDWSYDLLPEDERALFRRLAVFAGSFSLEAAEQVCAGEGLAETAVLDLVAKLVDKSLVVTEDAAAGEVRYEQLETVRQYALNRLIESGDTEAVRSRHRDFFLHLAEQAEPKLFGPEQKVWLDRLEAEHDNFRTALEWSRTDPGSVETGLRLAGALWWLWEVRGYWTEGRQWLTNVLARAIDSSTEAHVKALNAAGALAMRQGDAAKAAELARKSLALSRELGDKRGAASCLVILGIYACILEDYKQAEALGGESLSLSREVGDRWGTAWAKLTLGLVARAERDYAKATTLLEESLALSRAMGHQWSIADVTLHLGLIARDQGDLERAAALFEEAIAIFRQLGDKSFIAYSQLNLGTIASAMGEFGRAGTLYREALAVRKDLGDKRGIATCVMALACVAAGSAQSRRAAVLFGAAEAMREATGASIPVYFRSEHDRQVAAASAGLGEAAFKTAWAEGRALPAAPAVEFALAEDPHPARA